jgi:4-oxalomesaconate tautomerase
MTSQTPIRCLVFRGGTSKGLYFHASDLPSDVSTRDAVLLAAMGAPDAREIDGMGGGHPLTSKVAVIKKSLRDDADVDYLFLQVWPDRAEVSDNQNCGNLLAGVGPFALEEGLLEAGNATSEVRIWMENTQSLALAHIATPGGTVRYEGETHIDGVPGTSSSIPIEFLDIAGSTCGSLLPTGHALDLVNGLRVTCIDNGMPVVCVRADDLGLTGYEEPQEIEANEDVCRKVEQLRLAAGPLMNLGDVTKKSVPKVSLLAPAKNGGVIATRTFIPHRVHEAIGVLGAVSVATACVVPGSVAQEVAGVTSDGSLMTLDIEHPTGYFGVSLEVSINDGDAHVNSAALVRTARLLMRGDVLVPSTVWAGQ